MRVRKGWIAEGRGFPLGGLISLQMQVPLGLLGGWTDRATPLGAGSFLFPETGSTWVAGQLNSASCSRGCTR